MWIAVYKYMEATLGISLYNYLYLQLGKNTMCFLLSPMFSLQQNWRRGEEGDDRGGGLNNVYTCKEM
jgi:hypothetical protein